MICFSLFPFPSVSLKFLVPWFFIYLCTKLSPSWEAANCAAIQELPSIFKGPATSSPCSQEPSTGPYPEPVRSSPQHPILSLLRFPWFFNFCKVFLRILLTQCVWLTEWSSDMCHYAIWYMGGACDFCLQDRTGTALSRRCTVQVPGAYLLDYVSKDIPVTGRGGPWGCGRLRLPHYLDKWLIDGGKVVSPTRRPHFTPRFFF
jgi:hypothetical protein